MESLQRGLVETTEVLTQETQLKIVGGASGISGGFSIDEWTWSQEDFVASFVGDR